jgi:co-chaperonin GroES (HSP10)
MNEPFEWRVKGKVTPLRNRVLVEGMEHGETRTPGGIILTDDDGQARGIKPRWATVYAVGDDVTEVNPGDRVLIAHGRWTRGVQVEGSDRTRVIRMVELESIMGVAID